MERTVLLHHQLDNGDEHYDWLLERPSGRGLMSFRVDVRFDDGLGSWVAERIGDHRDEYLAYEGVISGGRGRVRRVASGGCQVVEDTESRVVVELDLGEITGLVIGQALDDEGLWRFEWED